MALAVNQQTDMTAMVAQAVIDNYPAGAVRFSDQTTPAGTVPVLRIDDADRAEVIVPASIPLTAVGPALANAMLPSDVWIIVAAERMGAAHRALRGTGFRLQPWWEDGRIQFGRPERS